MVAEMIAVVVGAIRQLHIAEVTVVISVHVYAIKLW
jgi:hypothetical protein